MTASRQFVILLYHGVTAEPSKGIENCSRKHIPAQEFDAQMRHLAANYDVLSLPELLERRDAGSLPKKPVAVTFDDGFENNHTTAFPILRDRGIPATFYLATGFIGTSRVFWVDKLEYHLNETELPFLRIDALERTFPIGSAAERERALAAIKAELKTRPGLIDGTLQEVEQQCGVAPLYDYANYRVMTWEQVSEMRGSGLCTFGCHTHDHVILAHLSPEEQAHQIRKSREVLEGHSREPVRLFSYPEGQSNHYDEQTIGLLVSEGFTSSPSAIFGVNDGDTSPFHLRRNMVGFTAPFEDCLGAFDAIHS